MELKNIITPKLLSIAYKIGIFLILTLPLISAPPYFHPADWGKSIVFRIIFSLMLFLFLWELILYPEKRRGIISLIKSSKLVWILSALVFIFVLATIFSLDPYFSFWGSPYRGDGSFNFILYVLFGIFCFLNIKKDDWQRFWDFALLIAVLVSFVGIAQSLDLLKNFLVSYGQASGTMGSSVSLGIYLVLLPFIALVFGFKNSPSQIFSWKAWTGTGKKAIFYYSCAFIFLLAINFTQSRAAFLGIGVGLLFFILFYRLRKTHQEKFFNKVFWLKTAAVLVIIAGVWTIILIKDNQSIINMLQKTPMGGLFYRVVTTVRAISQTKTLVPETRLPAWQIGLLAVKDRPILGYGPENFSIAFDNHIDPKFSQFGKLSWWDRAHNMFLGVAVDVGLLGLAVYIFLIVFVFWKLHQQKRKKPENYLIFHGIQTSFVAYFITGFFGFDNFGTFLIFNLTLGYCCCFFYGDKYSQTAFSESKEKNYIKYIFPISLVLLFWFLWTYNINPLLVNRNINWADFYLSKPDCQRAANEMEKSLAKHSIIDNYVILKYVNVISDGYCRRGIDKKEASEKKIELLRQAVKIRPYYTRSWALLGNALYNLEIVNENNGEKPNEDLREEADNAFKKAKQLCPKCQDVFSGVIKSYFASGEYELAKKTSDECRNLFPDFDECLWLKGLAEIYLNNISKGKEIIEEYYKLGNNPINYGTQAQLLSAYVAIKDQNKSREYYEDLVVIYQRLIDMNSSYAQYHASLAYIYSSLGRYAEARKEANEVLKLKPELKASVEAFLKTLPY